MDSSMLAFMWILVATYKYFVNIVPTKYIYLNGDTVTTFQYSVTEHETKVRRPIRTLLKHDHGS